MAPGKLTGTDGESERRCGGLGGYYTVALATSKQVRCAHNFTSEEGSHELRHVGRVQEEVRDLAHGILGLANWDPWFNRGIQGVLRQESRCSMSFQV